MGTRQLLARAMKLFFQWFAVLLLTVAAAAAQGQLTAGHDAPQTSVCGPPQYCARTDRRIELYPEKPPAIGPAGSIISDPTFGSRILRVTDGRSDPTQAGGPLYTPSGPEQNSWNKNSTMFYVTTSEGSFLLYDFDPATMTARPARSPKVDLGGEPEFSYQKANILYGMNRRQRVFEQYDSLSGQVTELNDPSKCVKLGSGDNAIVISVSADDNRFMTMLGPQQDKDYMVYVYDRARGCRWYNTETGEIGGQWGPKGTISVPDRFLLHHARIAKSGKFLYMTRGRGGIGHGWVAWEIDNMNVGVCSVACSAHYALGYSHIIGSSELNHPLDLWVRPLNQPDAHTLLISGLEPAKDYWFDSHLSWNNVDENDSAPICFSTYRPNNPDTPGAPPLVTGPWQNEIDCAETDGKASTVWRFAHTYSTTRNGFWSQPRGNVSQDGRFFMFTSDWEDQLGKTPKGDKYRTDVFIVQLR
jgi:hypothetical protein